MQMQHPASGASRSGCYQKCAASHLQASSADGPTPKGDRALQRSSASVSVHDAHGGRQPGETPQVSSGLSLNPSAQQLVQAGGGGLHDTGSQVPQARQAAGT